MRLASTTGDFDFYCNTYRERVQHLHEAGFRYIDLCMYTTFPNDELLVSENWRDNVARLKEYADGLGVQFVQAHSPGGFPLRKTGEWAEKYEQLLRTTLRSIEICGLLDIPNIVVHAGCRRDLGKKGFFEENREFFKILLSEAEKYNVNILVENSSRQNVACSTAYYTNTGSDMREFIEYVNHPLFHACWDTGHGNMDGGQYDEIMALGDELYALHINDNHEHTDGHLIPFMGTVNWDEVMCALVDSGYKGYFTLEASAGFTNVLNKKRLFEPDSRLRIPSLSMQKSAEKFMYETCMHILQSYECDEE